jgi:heme-degrading monooxygenase HmoA
MDDGSTARREVVGVNVFTIRPENQDRLVECLQSLGSTADVPGLISLRLFRSLDGSKMINYMEWETSEAFKKASTNPTVAAVVERAAELVEDGDPGLYKLVFDLT